MYASVRRYEMAREPDGEFLRVVREGFIPVVQQLDGFVDYYMVQGQGTLATVSVFETQEDAARSGEVAAEFIRAEGMSDFLPSPPQVTVGEVVAHGSRTGAMA